MSRRACGLLVPVVGALLGSACAIRGFVAPAGPPVPMSNAIAAWEEATSHCRNATTFSASIHLSGRAGGERLHGTIDGAVTSADQIRLDAHVLGQTAFVLAGNANSATFLLPRDNRVLTARAADIVEALTGLTWSPSELLRIFSGCLAKVDAAAPAVRIADRARFTTSAGDVYLRQRSGHWTIDGAVLNAITVLYDQVTDGWPHTLVIVRTGARPLSIKLRLDQIDTKDLPATAFAVTVPRDATPLTLEELRNTVGIKGQ